jgi:hypothetical protein
VRGSATWPGRPIRADVLHPKSRQCRITGPIHPNRLRRKKVEKRAQKIDSIHKINTDEQE